MHNGAIMPSEVRHRVDDGQTFPVVRFAGVLDRATGARVRYALLDVLAGQPEAVVVDVSDLDLAAGDALAVLRELHSDTADWPAAELVLCDSHDTDRWRPTGWPVWPDAAHAFAALGTPAADRRESLALEPVVGAARRCREMITGACARWELVDLAGPACIVATELVNNVVAHAHTRMIVLLAARDAGLSVAVRDDSATEPAFTGAPVSPTSYGGRGMLLIDSVAERWGSVHLEDGKVVWAFLESENGNGVHTPGRQRAAEGMADPARG
jgi:anti-anti-sigma regulatory factor